MPESFSTYIEDLIPSSDPYSKALKSMLTAVSTLTVFFETNEQIALPSNPFTGADYWFFAIPGTFPGFRLNGTQKIQQWQTDCELWVRFVTELESVPLLIEARGAVKATLESPHALKNVNVNNVTVTGGKLQQDVNGNTPNFIIQPLTITIDQIVTR